MLGIDISDRTVLRWIRKAPRNPEPAMRWSTSLSIHHEDIAAIGANALQSNIASQQALKGSQSIAVAAEEQSSAAEESAKTVAEQTQALAECEQTAQALSELAEDLKNSTDVAKGAEQVPTWVK
jgi:methyl-accepting chemotaxis protein